MDFNSDFPDVAPPSTRQWNRWQPGVNSNFPGYDHVFDSNLINAYELSFAPNESIYISSNVNVTLKINGDASFTNLYIANGSSLTIFMAGGKFILSGKTTVESSNAMSLCYFGLPSNTDINLPSRGTDTFFGTIYAPAANLTMNGANFNFIGSSIARSIILKGGSAVYFDENLLKVGPRRGYLVTSWQEL